MKTKRILLSILAVATTSTVYAFGADNNSCDSTCFNFPDLGLVEQEMIGDTPNIQQYYQSAPVSAGNGMIVIPNPTPTPNPTPAPVELQSCGMASGAGIPTVDNASNYTQNGAGGYTPYCLSSIRVSNNNPFFGAPLQTRTYATHKEFSFGFDVNSYIQVSCPLPTREVYMLTEHSPYVASCVF